MCLQFRLSLKWSDSPWGWGNTENEALKINTVTRNQRGHSGKTYNGKMMGNDFSIIVERYFTVTLIAIFILFVSI